MVAIVSSLAKKIRNTIVDANKVYTNRRSGDNELS